MPIAQWIRRLPRTLILCPLRMLKTVRACGSSCSSAAAMARSRPASSGRQRDASAASVPAPFASSAAFSCAAGPAVGADVTGREWDPTILMQSHVQALLMRVNNLVERYDRRRVLVYHTTEDCLKRHKRRMVAGAARARMRPRARRTGAGRP